MNIGQADRIRPERPVKDVKPLPDARVDVAAERLREARVLDKTRARPAPEREKGRFVDRYA
jgi:hypothetical protein